MAVPFAGLDSSVTLYPLRIALHLGLGGACPSAPLQSTSVPWLSRGSDVPAVGLRVCVHVCLCRWGLGESEWAEVGLQARHCAGEALSWVPPWSGQSRGRQGEGLPCLKPQA